MVLSSFYLFAIGVTIPTPDFGYASPVAIGSFALAIPTGLVYGVVGNYKWAQMAWLLGFTFACMTRGIALLFGQVDYLEFWQGLAASGTWFLLLCGGVLATLVIAAAEILEDVEQATTK